MEKQISVEKVYLELKRLEEVLLKKGLIEKDSIEFSDTTLLSEKSLAKEWLSPEEDEAWKDL
tara:strand:+ start:96 stop:281 length:186 start_codon:yes stop_codon:yes gene_type:complete